MRGHWASPSPAEGTLEGFLLKDEAKKQVSIRSKPVPGGRKAITKYRTLATRGNLSLVECDLITGRTHQIRAMMAARRSSAAGGRQIRQ